MTKAKALTAAKQRCQNERLRDAGHRQFFKRQPGHYLQCAFICLCQRIWGRRRKDFLRALIVSDLIAIHEVFDRYAFRLLWSCQCCGWGWSRDRFVRGGYEEIIHTVSNTLGIVSGIVCDGAQRLLALPRSLLPSMRLSLANMYKTVRNLKAGTVSLPAISNRRSKISASLAKRVCAPPIKRSLR